ncbi:MAG: hypothetical protein PHQ04_00865 [Opitutaceae bacterium]|nr:hypothetical protein [Opitutaceae bacterium]
MALVDMRKDYNLADLADGDLARDPFRQFEKWFQEAEAAKISEPNSMVPATSWRDGQPAARIVSLEGVDGSVTHVSREEAKTYFHGRPLGNQLDP